MFKILWRPSAKFSNVTGASSGTAALGCCDLEASGEAASHRESMVMGLPESSEASDTGPVLDGVPWLDPSPIDDERWCFLRTMTFSRAQEDSSPRSIQEVQGMDLEQRSFFLAQEVQLKGFLWEMRGVKAIKTSLSPLS